MWIAVPESEDGTWFDDPIGADTQGDATNFATAKWSGKLPAGIEVAIYKCRWEDALDLPKASTVTAEEVRGILAPAKD
jgi:hypothetical protein